MKWVRVVYYDSIKFFQGEILSGEFLDLVIGQKGKESFGLVLVIFIDPFLIFTPVLPPIE